MNFARIILPGAVMMLLSACNGLFSGIYDSPEEDDTKEYGFLTECTATSAGTIYIDATSYTQWTYIDFHNSTTDTREIDEAEPDSWDLAIHRYDAKTNGGSVAETGSGTFQTLLDSGSATVGEYVSDIWTTEKIITDMSTMMEGYLGYAESYYNEELSKWLFVDTSTMPPIYTPSEKIYIVRMADGTKAAVYLENYMNTSAVKGYMTIRYIYPISL